MDNESFEVKPTLLAPIVFSALAVFCTVMSLISDDLETKTKLGTVGLDLITVYLVYDFIVRRGITVEEANIIRYNQGREFTTFDDISKMKDSGNGHICVYDKNNEFLFMTYTYSRNIKRFCDIAEAHGAEVDEKIKRRIKYKY